MCLGCGGSTTPTSTADMSTGDMTPVDMATDGDLDMPTPSDMQEDLPNIDMPSDLVQPDMPIEDMTAEMSPPMLLERYTLPGDGLFPESVAYDPKRHRFYVGSLEKGNVLSIAADGQVQEIYPGTGEPSRFTLGVKVHEDMLVVCSYLNEKPVTGRVWIFDLNTNQRLHDIDLTQVVPNGSCSDVVVDPNGVIYTNDRELPHVYKIKLIDGQAPQVSLWANDAQLTPPRVGVGQNGLALTADGKYLITGHYIPPKFWRIALDDPTEVREIEIVGEITGNNFFAGVDGIVMVNDELFASFGKRLMRLTSEDNWLTANPVFVDVDVAIAAVTLAQGDLYVLKSDIPKFVLGGDFDLPFELIRVPLTRFP